MSIIICDSLEKKPFDLSFYGFESVRKRLLTGDYSVQGKEDYISIDRKSSISELVQNLFYDYKRFKKEMIRAKEIPQFFLVCEFSEEYIHIFPNGSNIPKRKWQGLRATSELIIHKLELIYTAYNVKTIFCENRQEAEQMTVNLLNRAINGESFDDVEFWRK